MSTFEETCAHIIFIVCTELRICLARSLRLALVAQSIRLVLPLEKSRSSPIKCALSSKAVGADGALMREFAGGKPPLGRGNVAEASCSSKKNFSTGSLLVDEEFVRPDEGCTAQGHVKSSTTKVSRAPVVIDDHQSRGLCPRQIAWTMSQRGLRLVSPTWPRCDPTRFVA